MRMHVRCGMVRYVFVSKMIRHLTQDLRYLQTVEYKGHITLRHVTSMRLIPLRERLWTLIQSLKFTFKKYKLSRNRPVELRQGKGSQTVEQTVEEQEEPFSNASAWHGSQTTMRWKDEEDEDKKPLMHACHRLSAA